jgi:hypothetical protein
MKITENNNILLARETLSLNNFSQEEQEKFLEERGFWISKGTMKITGTFGFYIIERIEVE